MPSPRVAATLALCCAALLSSAQTGTRPAPPSADLAGLWASEQVLGPLVRGTLTIDARGSAWRARIAGFDLPVERNGGGGWPR